MNREAEETGSLPLFADAVFECGSCSEGLTCTYEQVHALISDQLIQCVACQQSLKADHRDQEVLEALFKKRVSSGKFVLVFFSLFFTTNIFILLIYGSAAAGVMFMAGALISIACKSSFQSADLIVLNPAAGGNSVVCLEKADRPNS